MIVVRSGGSSDPPPEAIFDIQDTVPASSNTICGFAGMRFQMTDEDVEVKSAQFSRPLGHLLNSYRHGLIEPLDSM